MSQLKLMSTEWMSEDLQKAFMWFESKGIDVKIHENAYLVIVCNGYEIEIAEHEIEWRAVMFDLGK